MPVFPKVVVHGVTIRAPIQHLKKLRKEVGARIQELQVASCGRLSPPAQRRTVISCLIELGFKTIGCAGVGGGPGNVTGGQSAFGNASIKGPHAIGRVAQTNGHHGASQGCGDREVVDGPPVAHASGRADLIPNPIIDPELVTLPVVDSTMVPPPGEANSPKLEQPLDTEVQCGPTERHWHWLGALSDGDGAEIQISRKLGKGSYGKVYSALFRGREYALKVQSIEPTEPLVVQVAYEEIQTLRALGGPGGTGVIKVLGYFISKFNIQILTELFDMDLQHYIVRHEPGGPNRNITEGAARLVCKFIAMGLQHMHSNGYVHRDLKPANIMVRVEPLQAAIADLGVALKREGDKENVTTPTYLAPEVFLGGGYIKACDIWSFGLIAMEMENPMMIRSLCKGIADWNAAARQFYWGRLLALLRTGKAQSYKCFSLSRRALSVPLAEGGQCAFGHRFTGGPFDYFVRGMLATAPHQRREIQEVSQCAWLQCSL